MSIQSSVTLLFHFILRVLSPWFVSAN